MTSLFKPLKAAKYKTFWAYDLSKFAELVPEIPADSGVLVTDETFTRGEVFVGQRRDAAGLQEQLRQLRQGDQGLDIYAVSPRKLGPNLDHKFIVSDLGKAYPDASQSPTPPLLEACNTLGDMVSAYARPNSAEPQDR